MQNVRLDESKAEIKSQENTNNLRYADDIALMAENEQELKSLLMKVEEQSEKAGLQLNIQKTKIMALGPIASWMGEMWKQCQISFSWPPKSLQTVTAATKLKDTCSWEDQLCQTQTRDWSWTLHVADHALITWPSCTDHMADHTLIT